MTDMADVTVQRKKEGVLRTGVLHTSLSPERAI